MKLNKRSNNQGFTIVELMIATAILGLILLLVTSVMISIGDLFYKGVSLTRTQNNARTITDQVAEDLKYNNQFSYGYGSEILGSGSNTDTVQVSAYCIGSVRYSFVTGYMIGSGSGNYTYEPSSNIPETPDVIIRDYSSGSVSVSDLVQPYTGGCDPINVTALHLNLATTDPDATELIASDSRLASFSITGSGPYTIYVDVAYGYSNLLNLVHTPATCVGGAGDDFCGTANLQTTVVQSLTGGA
jgi:prepilin-type N-terminal cleavage/methylation domain-containing protein